MTYNLSEIMKAAWGYRAEGMSQSESLSQAWKDVKESTEALMELKKELTSQLDWVNAQLEAKKNNKSIYEFDFSSDTRKRGCCYAARITGIDDEGKLIREFINLDRDYNKNDCRVYGTFEITEGEIIEMRTGGSWKNDYRDFYICKNGNLEHLCSSYDKKTVKEYLK
jgi:hypothetical protein